MTNDLRRRIESLSPERRALLEAALKQRDFTPSAKRGIPRRQGAGPWPLSFSQQRLWFLDQLEPGNPQYNMILALRLEGSLDCNALQRTLDEIVARHESIRTNLRNLEGDAVQVIGRPCSVQLEHAELKNFKGADDAEFRALVEEKVKRPFDLSHDLMLRPTLLRLGPREHILLLVMHHVTSDGWSYQVLFREIKELYGAFAGGKAPSLPELPIQYADYAVWQRQWLQGEILEKQVAYWKEQLGGVPAGLQLPADFPTPARSNYRAAHEQLLLSEALVRSLQQLSRRHGATLFMAMMAALQTLLYRLTQQDDVVVGFPIAGRQMPEVEGLIGFFVNTMVLRTSLAGNPAFQELLGRVRKVATEAYSNQDIPFEKLVEEVSPERSLNRNPFFDVMLNFMDGSWPAVHSAGLTISRLEVPHVIARFAAALYASPQGGRVRLRLVYRRELFSHERMASFLQQFRYLLEQIAAAPENSILSYSLVTPESRGVLPLPSERLGEPRLQPATALFAVWAKQTPDQPAVCQGERSWSYAELSNRAEAVAKALRARELGRGDVVAVSGPRSFGLIAGMLGVLQSGGVLLPIDPSLPTKRRRLMAQEAQAKAVIHVGSSPPEDALLEAGNARDALIVDPSDASVRGQQTAPDLDNAPLPEPGPDDPAYIFFTSGTTGVPKAVLGCHKGLSHFLNWQREAFQIGPADRTSQLTTLSFDVILRDVFLPLTTGGALCLPGGDAQDPREVMRWLERERISVLHTVPSLAQSWLAELPSGISLCSLRWVFFAGEPLTEALVRRWRETFPECGKIVNLYGPTETTMVKCFYPARAEPLPGVQPVGRPLPETQALVLTENNQLCGVGEPGEIVLRTPFRTLGYLNAPRETAKRFARNPFRDDERDILYYTGDQGRYRPDGTLDILGRLDDQVKIGGVRIEPGEVAAVLAGHPAVKSCYVGVRTDPQGEPYLAAYVATSTADGVTAEDLRSYLQNYLPAAMLPRTFVFLERLPLTPQGKVDRRALPEPELPEAGSTAIFVAPRSAAEEVIAEIWKQVLGIDKLGVHDNFFDLGGHSLLATRIQSRISASLGTPVSLREFFEAPTIAGLGELVSKGQPD